MSSKMLNYQEFLIWLIDNKDKVLHYIENNDVDLRDADISGRAYTVLRVNGKNYISDILFCTEQDIDAFNGIAKSTREEILLFKREYLREHKKAIMDFVQEENANITTESIDVKESTVIETALDIAPQEDMQIQSSTEILSCASNESEISYIRTLLTDVVTKEKIIAFVEKYSKEITTTEFSTRSFNILKRNKINFLHEAIKYYPEEFYSLHNMGKLSVDEVCDYIEKFLLDNFVELNAYINGTEIQYVEVSPYQLDVLSLIKHPQYKERAREYIKAHNVMIDGLDLSVRSKNALFQSNIKSFYDLVDGYPNNIASIRNLGSKSIEETKQLVHKMLDSMQSEITAYCSGDVNENEFRNTKISPYSLTLLQLIKHEHHKDKAIEYLAENNISVDAMGLSERSKNALKNASVFTFLDLLQIYPSDIYIIQNIGKKSLDEITRCAEYYLSKFQNSVAAYCVGDINAIYSDEFIFDAVLSCFKNRKFSGLSYNQIKQELPGEIDDARLKKCIGILIKSKKLEYVDFRLHRVYPSVVSIVQASTIDEINKEIISKKLNGATLESIGQELGITRERVRQLITKSFGAIHKQLRAEQEDVVFDEDYYVNLYSNYSTEKELWVDYLGVPIETYGYLVNFCSKGRKTLEEALVDSEIDLILKYKIQDYLNRDKISLDGHLIKKNRADIEKYVLSKIGRDEIHFDEFCEGYNALLKENDIEFDEKIYYTEGVRRTRGNHLTESMFCLWKQGERLRYYDIEGQDYKELFDALHLENYENTEVSTLKFINDYPEIMEKYDIRDQYELHNLLKKTINANEYNDISFKRQPMIQFGEFDRDKAIYEIIAAFAPISVEDLLEYIYLEYGYDKATAQALYVQPFNKYLHKGVYSIDFKKILEERVSVLKSNLSEDFYYISQVQEIYSKLFVGADIEEINTYTLKSMGFLVYSKYAVQNFSSAEAYFKHILTANDIYNISLLNKKYMNTGGAFYNTAMALRRNYDIFLFEKDQIITMNRLTKLGITKEDIKTFCDDVANFVSTKYFTIHFLRETGFVSELDNLGFDDYFYAGILAMDTRFLWQTVFDTIILTIKEGEVSNTFTKKDFLLYEIAKYSSIDVDDFIIDCFNEYGVKIERYEIKQIFAGTQVYYDSIMDKLYSDKKYYYEEFDE